MTPKFPDKGSSMTPKNSGLAETLQMTILKHKLQISASSRNLYRPDDPQDNFKLCHTAK